MNRRQVIGILLLGLGACLRCARATPPPSRDAQLLKSVPLRFPSPWLRGALVYDAAKARSITEALPLTVSLELGDVPSALAELQTGPIPKEPCYQVRLLYRRDRTAPPRVITPGAFDLPVFFSEAPTVCLEVGAVWSWRALLVRQRNVTSSDLNGRLAHMTTGEGRSAGEEFAVQLTRRPQSAVEFREYPDNLEQLAVARSAWISFR